MRYIFGPVSSRRFGSSLGIDLSPDKKCCNYDCLYCELKAAKVVSAIAHPPKVADIISELKVAIKEFGTSDVITLTANGEPSLYPYLGELIDEINAIKTTQKTLILSNGSSVFDERAVSAMKKFDIVKFSLDSATQRTFRLIDRGIKNLNIDEMIEKMSAFCRDFSGDLVMEVLVLEGFNDNDEEFAKLNAAFAKIRPTRVDISTLDRPPAHKEAKAVNSETIVHLSSLINSVPVSIACRKPLPNKFDFSIKELEKILALRPQSEFDVKNNYSDKSKKNLQSLIDSGIVITQNLAGVKFFRV